MVQKWRSEMSVQLTPIFAFLETHPTFHFQLYIKFRLGRMKFIGLFCFGILADAYVLNLKCHKKLPIHHIMRTGAFRPSSGREYLQRQYWNWFALCRGRIATKGSQYVFSHIGILFSIV